MRYKTATIFDDKRYKYLFPHSGQTFYMKQHTPQQKLGIYNYCIFCMPRQNYIKNTLPPKLDMNILKETNRKINKIYSFLNVNAYKLYVCIANTNGPEFRFLSSPP